MLRTLGAIAAMALMAACSKPYDTPAFDAGGQELPETDAAVRFGGIASMLDTGRRAEVLWTHGMCTHRFTWAVYTHATMRAMLQAALGKSGSETDPLRRSRTVSEAYRFRLDTPKGELWTTYFIWSGATDAFKDKIAFDNAQRDGGAFSYERAKINGLLKHSLLNDCLSDAVIVAGANRARLYDDARSVVCRFLGGNEYKPGTSICRFGSDASRKPPENDGIPRVLVAESLGSKIVFDAVLALRPEPGEEAILDARLASIRQIFLLANQIPLLDLADTQALTVAGRTIEAGAVETSSLSRVLQRVSRGRSRSAKRLQVVAFTDPNDLLSYRLLDGHVASARARLVNVLVSNDWTYESAFLNTSFQRPDTAHCDYRLNKDVMSLVAVGNPGFGDATWRQVGARYDPAESKGCGFTAR